MKSLFLIILFIFSFIETKEINQITYKKNTGFLGRLMNSFMFRITREKGIYAEYKNYAEEYGPLKTYYIKNEDLGIIPTELLFKEFEKIDWPEQTDWSDHQLFDVPYWSLIVDDVTYYSNVGTDFLEKFNKLVDIRNIYDYCVENYK